MTSSARGYFGPGGRVQVFGAFCSVERYFYHVCVAFMCCRGLGSGRRKWCEQDENGRGGMPGRLECELWVPKDDHLRLPVFPSPLPFPQARHGRGLHVFLCLWTSEASAPGLITGDYSSFVPVAKLVLRIQESHLGIPEYPHRPRLDIRD